MEKSHRHWKRLGALLTVFLCGCSAVPAGTPSGLPVSPEPLDSPQMLLDGMTLEEKVGQLFLVRPDALDFSLSDETVSDPNVSGVTSLTPELQENLQSIPVGGIVLFGKNLESPEQCRSMLEAWQNAGAIPLLTAVDEEGGAVARLANTAGFHLPRFESAAAVGRSGDPRQAMAMGQTIGTYLAEYGFLLNFAPVADVNTNPDNPIIGNRAFSSDPAIAAEMVSAAVEGFHSSGIACTLKHFPGHGDTTQDSHLGAVVTYRTWEQMLEAEMLPFQAGIEAGAELVMLGHISTPNATTDGLPASMSSEWITRLRQELGFSGLVVTDSLSMQAITDCYSSGEAAIAALNAGADILLMPENLTEAYNAVLYAVADGTISQARIDESVLRILCLKRSLHLL